MAGRARSDGLRLTRVGLWFLLFGIIVALAATNTGNNGLFLVLAMMGAILLVSHVMARANVGRLEVSLELPAEIFANSPAHLGLELRNRSAWLPRWLLVAAVEPESAEPASRSHKRRALPMLAPHLAAGETRQGGVELLLRRRGLRRVRHVHVSSLFPLGLFRKGMRYPVARELLVFPELFAPSSARPEQTGRAGDEPTRRVGWGHELFSLRPYRHGDDPRGIHWKQSARTGDLVFTERETEENRRLSVVFDNAVGQLENEAARGRFERLVSEAATAALDYLGRGFEVELLTRGERLDFAGGARQRRRVLEVLALVEPVARTPVPLVPDRPRAPYLCLAMDLAEEAA